MSPSNDFFTSDPEMRFDYDRYFLNISKLDSDAVMRSYKELTFHIWTDSAPFYHVHENYVEIFIVTAGKSMHRFGDKSTVLRTGDAVIVMPGQYHGQAPYKNYTSQHINITCSLSFAANLFRTYFGTETPDFTTQLIHFSDAEFAVVKNLQAVILKSQNEEHMNAGLRSLLSFALSFFRIPDRLPHNSEDIPAWLLKFIQELNSIDFSQQVCLPDICELSGYSHSTLSRQFKKYMGQTLVSYISDLKLMHACNLLKSTTFTLTDVATISGFDSYPHFSRVFKSKYNLTPQQYRNMPK